MIELEIDNRPISVEPGTSIIEAADKLGIYIPRFCYHKKLSIAANCRMCLVEVEKVGKALPACATPVTHGMKVYTVSKKAIEAQRMVMEFLLINHPLDCPICDQGGECELQDLSMGYGSSHSYYEQSKRAVFDEDIGPLIDTEMTRCIQCTRCVRFGEEIAGLRELGVTYRGEHEQIGTYVKHMMQSEVAGNVIDLCPVGALTAKPSRYSLRGWEVFENPTIAPHDCVGSNLFIHSRMQEFVPQRQVMRVVPRENAAINETWISDRDRFSYLGLTHSQRVVNPSVKKNGVWQEMEWQPALLEIADRLQAIIHEQSPDQIAALVSPSASLEEMYLLQKWLRAFGCDNIDHRLRQQDFSDQDFMPLYPDLGMKIADIETVETVVLIGSHIRYEQPLLGLRINKAVQEGAKIVAINPMDYHFMFPLQEKIISADIVYATAEVLAALGEGTLQPSSEAIAIAKLLKNSKKTAIFLGEYALSLTDAAVLRVLVRKIQALTGASIGFLTEGANSAGAWLVGAVPHRGPAAKPVTNPGAHALDVLTQTPKRAYILLGIEPEMDCIASAAAVKTLKQAGTVVCLSTFTTPQMEEYADFILPITPFTETVGTYINVEGVWQSSPVVSVPAENAKPAWKILRVLANLMELPGFDYADIHVVFRELSEIVDSKEWTQPMPATHKAPQIVAKNKAELLRLAPWLLYRIDPLTRRAGALQATMSKHLFTIAIHENLAKKLNLAPEQKLIATQGDSQVILPWHIDNRLAENVVFIPSALEETAGFGHAFAAVSLRGENG
jgi:NADH-quinone oxidoreductase subunit G